MMDKYWVINKIRRMAYGPFESWSEANSAVAEANEIIVKLCPPENELGAPNVYPFNIEEYDDGKEG